MISLRRHRAVSPRCHGNRARPSRCPRALISQAAEWEACPLVRSPSDVTRSYPSGTWLGRARRRVTTASASPDRRVVGNESRERRARGPAAECRPRCVIWCLHSVDLKTSHSSVWEITANWNKSRVSGNTSHQPPLRCSAPRTAPSTGTRVAVRQRWCWSRWRDLLQRLLLKRCANQKHNHDTWVRMKSTLWVKLMEVSTHLTVLLRILYHDSF